MCNKYYYYETTGDVIEKDEEQLQTRIYLQIGLSLFSVAADRHEKYYSNKYYIFKMNCVFVTKRETWKPRQTPLFKRRRIEC